MNIFLRPIEQRDNAAIAVIIRNALKEFGADKPGTVYYDASTDALYELFREKRAAYFIAESDGEILGGAGIFPTEGLPADTCELVKMYLAPAARGLGVGKKLMEQCFAEAIKNGFENIYLETMPELAQAVKVYERFGFQYLPKAMGNSGHCGCGIWMLKTSLAIRD